MKGVEQAENGKDKEVEATSKTQTNNQSNQNQQPPNQTPANTLATRIKQAIDKKKKIAKKGTTGTVKPYSTI